MSVSPLAIDDYLWKRFGYGSYSSKLWFVGIEEGGGTSEEFEEGVKVWCARGKPEIDNIRAYHEQCGAVKWFVDPPAFQRTWDGLIRIALAAVGIEPSNRDIQQYQLNEFARTGSNEAVLELFPLPSKSVKDWIYEGYSKDPRLSFLADKRRYRRHVILQRQDGLRSRIASYRPRVVIYYGLSFRPFYETIAGANFETTLLDKVFALRTSTMLHVLTLHPADFRSSHRYFSDVGRFIRSALDGTVN